MIRGPCTICDSSVFYEVSVGTCSFLYISLIHLILWSLSSCCWCLSLKGSYHQGPLAWPLVVPGTKSFLLLSSLDRDDLVGQFSANKDKHLGILHQMKISAFLICTNLRHNTLRYHYHFLPHWLPFVFPSLSASCALFLAPLFHLPSFLLTLLFFILSISRPSFFPIIFLSLYVQVSFSFFF